MTGSASRLTELLHSWIASRVEATALAWLDDRAAAIATGDKKTLFLGFGMVPRKVGKPDVTLSDAEMAQAETARPGWNPRGWSLDQLARTFLVLSFPSEDAALYVQTLDQLFQAGEVGELVSLYQALPLLPNPASHVLRTAEGIRSNIKSVFCAIAHQNPYPAEQLNDEQWNQLVLKCLFIDVSLDPLIGIDRRANAKLMTTLIDFAHERRAAHRPIPPDLWRCVGPFADERALDDLRLVLTTGSPLEQQAAARALKSCPAPRAAEILREVPAVS
ncbi:MAG: EboA domain-containing protein [Candidatus Saccharimonas sp.]|nr:EboA domain-containing protein [Planctomycetaceae bacterium]